MARSSPEKRRAVRKIEAMRDDLMSKQAKIKTQLASTRAALKTARRGRVV